MVMNCMVMNWLGFWMMNLYRTHLAESGEEEVASPKWLDIAECLSLLICMEMDGRYIVKLVFLSCKMLELSAAVSDRNRTCLERISMHMALFHHDPSRLTICTRSAFQLLPTGMYWYGVNENNAHHNVLVVLICFILHSSFYNTCHLRLQFSAFTLV